MVPVIFGIYEKCHKPTIFFWMVQIGFTKVYHLSWHLFKGEIAWHIWHRHFTKQKQTSVPLGPLGRRFRKVAGSGSGTAGTVSGWHSDFLASFFVKMEICDPPFSKTLGDFLWKWNDFFITMIYHDFKTLGDFPVRKVLVIAISGMSIFIPLQITILLEIVTTTHHNE